MEDWRRAAKLAIESSGAKAVLAEEFTVATQSPRGACLDGVANADSFVLLLGTRYGDKLPSGMSATEEEWQAARRAGKAILVFTCGVNQDADQRDFMRQLGAWSGGDHWTPAADPCELMHHVVARLLKLRASEDSDLASARVRSALGLVTIGARADDERPRWPRLSVAFCPLQILTDTNEDYFFGHLPEELRSVIDRPPVDLVEFVPPVTREAERIVFASGDDGWHRLELYVDLCGSVGMGIPLHGGKHLELAHRVVMSRECFVTALAGALQLIGIVIDRLDPERVVLSGLLSCVFEIALPETQGAGDQRPVGYMPTQILVPRQARQIARGELRTPKAIVDSLRRYAERASGTISNFSWQ